MYTAVMYTAVMYTAVMYTGSFACVIKLHLIDWVSVIVRQIIQCYVLCMLIC